MAEVAGEEPRSLLLERRDLTIEHRYQVTQALDADGVGLAQVHLVQEMLAARAEEIAHRHGDAFFGEDRLHLGFQSRAQVDELRPVPDELTELS
ncbi:MAG: hypothetical protein ACYCV7_08945 [Acidimicrobiales bacterium]